MNLVVISDVPAGLGVLLTKATLRLLRVARSVPPTVTAHVCVCDLWGKRQ